MRRNNFIERGRGRRVGPVLHIYCKGETEESYLNAYKRFGKYSSCEIEHSHHTDPVGLVTEAIKAKESAPLSDSYWVAYDLEDVSLLKGKPPSKVILLKVSFGDFNGLMAAKNVHECLESR